MDDNKMTHEWMARMEESSRKQERYAKWQCIFSAVAALSCVAVLVLAVCMIPTVSELAGQMQTVIADVQQVSSQLAQADWEGLTSDLEAVTQQMASADLGGLAEDVTALVQSSQVGLEEALGKLNAIDLEKLNKAISDLSEVIEPMAKFAKLF